MEYFITLRNDFKNGKNGKSTERLTNRLKELLVVVFGSPYFLF